MFAEKKIKTTLFGEEVVLDFGLRFSGRLRQLYPNWEELASEGDPVKVILIATRPSLPAQFHNKTEDEVLDEIDNIDDPMVINRCIEGFKAAMGFLATALTGAVNAAVAVQKGAKK